MPKEINMSDKVQAPAVEQVPTEEKKATESIQTESTKDTKKKTSIPLSKKKKIYLWVGISALALLLVGGIASFYYFGIYKLKPYKKPSDIVNLNGEYLLSNSKAFYFLKGIFVSPEEPRTEESAINGLLFTKSEMDELKDRRPVAVMINNHAVARPQSGLNSADVVFETDVESGITRYLAIFWSEAPAKVGPIRSARQYYLEWLSPFDPLYIYDGCASSTDVRVNACGNIYSYNLKNIATIGAWRWNDGRRYAPHNEYSSITNAWEYAEKQGWDDFPNVENWQFKSDAPVTERGEKSKVSVVFHERLNNSGLYDTVWTYDSKTNTYLRQVGGSAHIDQESNTQVYAKNVVIQEVSLTPTYDDKSRVIIGTIGQGKAVFLMDGKVTEGTWKKTSRTDRTTYYDSDGNEIKFNRGRIWISATPRSVGKFDIIE